MKTKKGPFRDASLLKDIVTLENMENLSTGQSDLLNDKRIELEDLHKTQN